MDLYSYLSITEVNSVVFYVGYPFEIVNSLFYNINLTDKIKRFYVFKNIVPIILKIIYDEKYYFSRD